jgi:glutamate racemase
VISVKQPHILVFDSGVGGLSVVEAIRKTNPFCKLTYASDNAHFPYGTKATYHLIDRVERVLTSLQKKISADIIVVACNTASTVVLPKIRSHFSLPIIGVVPAIKPAAEITNNNTIALLATPGTINRDYTKQLIADFASHCKIISVGSSELVLLAEKKLQNKSISIKAITEITEPFRTNDNHCLPDTLVLACTHFPLLKNELMSALPNINHWIDSGDAIARRIQFWTEELNLKIDNTLIPELPEGHSIFTKKTDEMKLIKPVLDKLNLGRISYMEIK